MIVSPLSGQRSFHGVRISGESRLPESRDVIHVNAQLDHELDSAINSARFGLRSGVPPRGLSSHSKLPLNRCRYLMRDFTDTAVILSFHHHTR